MPTPAGTLTEFATVLLLLRDHPDRKEDLRLAFKQFVVSISQGDHRVRLTPEGFRWNNADIPMGRGELAALHDHLRAHGVGEIRFPVGLMASIVLSLLNTLAAPAGSYGSFDHLTARLDAAGCGAVPVLPLSDADRLTHPLGANLAPPAPGRPAKLEKLEDDGHLDALGPDALTEAKVGMMHFATLQPHAVRPTMEVLSQLEQGGAATSPSDTLNQLMVAGEMATRQAEWGELCRACYAVVELEQKEGKTGDLRGYGIALRRLLPRSAMERIAQLAARGHMKAEAVAVLRRMGADGTEVLLSALVNAEDLSERATYFAALKEMTAGGELLIHMLSHDQWFVVRNVADPVGEIRLESAVHGLAKQIGHPDERVRRSVAGALAKIGGVGAIEPLRRALRDPSAAVRLQAVQDLDGRRNKGLAMSLAVAAEEEARPEIQKEMYLGLGRIASPEAIQALRKAAEPGGWVFRRKPPAVRLNAVQGLHAAGPSAANVLKELLEDGDKDVKEAAERALQTLWE